MTPCTTRGDFVSWLELQPALGPFSLFVGLRPYAADDTTGKLYPLDTISPQPSPSRKAGVREVAA